jgi:actin related protein 2/3 complex subunit 1A/1B
MSFNTLCAEYSTPSGGWVHAVAFSPSGDALAFAGHDSSITFVYPDGQEQPPLAHYVILLDSRPYVTLTWPSENTVVAAGHDCEHVLFTGAAHTGWEFARSLEGLYTVPRKNPKGAGAKVASGGSTTLASNIFRCTRTARMIR